MAGKTLKQLDNDCQAWRSLAFGVINLGKSTLTLKGLADEKGWTDTSEACDTFARAIADSLERFIVPAVEAHHAEHHAARLEAAELEAALRDEEAS